MIWWSMFAGFLLGSATRWERRPAHGRLTELLQGREGVRIRLEFCEPAPCCFFGRMTDGSRWARVDTDTVPYPWRDDD